METTIILIGGPTASGKSDFALSLAHEQDGVIINADSMQVYRELPIITAHPDQSSQKATPHKLYGFLSAAEPCSVALWLKHVQQEISVALDAKKVPVVVGGTGMYFKCLIEGIAAIPDITPEIRNKAREMLDNIGNEAFYALLTEVDPEAGERVNPGDSQRMLRAWEVIQQTGISLYDWQRNPVEPPYPSADFQGYFINPPREKLYARCNERFLHMLDAGALKEIKALDAMQLDSSLPAMKALGVPELLAHLHDKLTLQDATSKAQQSTRNYAKRQVTWFKNQFPNWKIIESTPWSASNRAHRYWG